MKNKDIFEALGGIDADVVLAAAPEGAKVKKNVRKPHKHGWIKWIVVAACLSLLVTTAFAAGSGLPPFEEPVVNNGTELAADDALVVALVEYMNELEVDHDMPAITTADKMDAIRDGQQALHVAFDSSKPYFVCAYSADGQQSDEYTWLKYANVGDITKEYEDLQMTLAFQINPSLFVKDIMTEDATVPTMEHFQPYEPQFNEGVNTKAADTFDETFIYLNSSEGDALYHSTTAYDHEWVTVPCRYFENEYYVEKKTYIEFPDGSREEIDTYSDLGEYYDGIEPVTHESYKNKNEDGTVSGIGLVKVELFTDVIKSTIEENEELSGFFEFMEREDAEIDKVSFEIKERFSHYFDGKMDKSELRNDFWVPSEIYVAVWCDYNLATEEEWYKACEDTKLITLNTALYNEYSDELSNKHLFLSSHFSHLKFSYFHADENRTDKEPISNALSDFYADYEIIKKLAELKYVTRIEVKYFYSFYEA